MHNYLDTGKSIIISSPAGSGKTEKLARRYIALLKSGVELERILAITFTDKAAAEMKQRILRILKQEDSELFRRVLDKMPLMRVSTIHSFCGTLLRRFSFEAAIDPNYSVEDAIDSHMVWEDMLYEVLMEAGKGAGGHELLLQTLGEKGFRGLDYLRDTADYLYQKNPFSLEARTFLPSPAVTGSIIEELKSWQGVSDLLDGYKEVFEGPVSGKLLSLEDYFLTKNKEPRKRPVPPLKNIIDYGDWAFRMYLYWKDIKIEEYARRTERIREIYAGCLEKYSERKRSRGSLDFSDLEYLAYRMLTDNHEWANILYAFDEKTDHILVDEFQDTNTFQWGIIDKLTEEWRAGQGAKREEGIRPTVFFVGDEKQSIYFFRGANVEIFQRAREKMEAWLGDEFLYEEVRENYRSRPAIVEFTNRVFSKIMGSDGRDFPWVTKYTPFSAYKTDIPGPGRVELILLDDKDGTTQEEKEEEAEILAQRIKGLAGDFRITESKTGRQRPCRYMDMALLLRKRTHLKKYEEALRKYNIPFVAVKGVGFYQEAEVAMLRAFVFFLSNPRDDYSLYLLLKSPLFGIDEDTIIRIINTEGDSLYSKLQGIINKKSGAGGLPENHGSEAALFSLPGKPDPLEDTASLLREWLSRLPYTRVPELIENALVRTKAWRHFHEAQKRANIKKFIRIIEDLEAAGKSLLRMRDFLERTYDRSDEPKANVNTEGMDAVKIMTIHAAKGLEFPLVFMPGIEEPFMMKTGDSLVYEKDGGFYFKSIPEASIRKQDEDFLIHLAKEEEELKRLFYVAVTRAEEALFLIGHWKQRERNFLSFLKHGLGLEKDDSAYTAEADIQGLSILTEDDVRALSAHTPRHETVKRRLPPVETFPLTIQKRTHWKTVTETADIRRRHGKDWTILGDIIHRIFEGVSKGVMREDDVMTRAEGMLESKGIIRGQIPEKTLIIEQEITSLKQKGIWQDIIMPRHDSWSELPFVYEAADAVYTGRIDRIIKENGRYKVYDYKTFPVTQKETGYLLREYAFQLDIYRKAVKKLFNTNDVKTFIIFTHIGEIKEV